MLQLALSGRDSERDPERLYKSLAQVQMASKLKPVQQPSHCLQSLSFPLLPPLPPFPLPPSLLPRARRRCAHARGPESR